MDILKEIGGLAFTIGLPLLCLFLIRRSRIQNKNMPFLGWSLFVFGIIMAFLTAAAYISMLFIRSSPMYLNLTWFIAFSIWLIYFFILAYAGWLLRRKRT